ncbi:MAG: hypothetical protein KDD60_08055 [Bdellovibrionales bacterium]|nr:hypothetical protein [Bdellovibrionales bacterium]
MKNLGLKIWSVVIAFSLAYFVHGQSNRSIRSLIVPVELRNLPSNTVVLLPNAPQAQVTIRGPSYILTEIAKDPLSFTVRVPEGAGFRYKTALQSNMIGLPPSVEVLSIEPAEIEFVLDTLVEKSLKVEVPRIGNLRDDLRLGKLTISPPTVVATGPRTDLQSLETVETEQLDLRSISASEVKIMPIAPPGKFTKLAPDKVSVSVEVNLITREKQFRDIPVVVSGDNLSQQYSVTPSKTSLHVIGPRALVQRLTKDDIMAEVQLEKDMEAGSDTSSLPVQIKFPEGVTGIEILSLQPEKVRVTKVR